jgi:signal transduction histidine kinase
MRRALLAPVLVAALAVAAVVTLSLLTYRNVRHGYQAEFATRLAGIAGTGASQVRPADVADAHLLGEAGGGYLAIQILMQGLCATPGTADATLIDSAGVVLYDCRGVEWQGQHSVLDTLAHAALARALAGRPAVSTPFRSGGATRHAGLAPVLADDRHVVAVVAVEAEPGYVGPLAELRQRLLLLTVLITLALVILAAVIVRGALAAARLERRLSRSENLAAMGRLTATLAHEIKNPLAIIRASAKRLGRLEGEPQRMADYVIEEVDRLSGTVARYLEFARGGEVPPGAGDARATLDATLALLDGECRARRVEVVRAGAWPDPAPVALDPDSLKQVWLNLLLNAFEAMPDGGRVTVSLDERRGAFEAAIADRGTGMTSEMLKRAGEPFVTTKAKGSGLGLFLTRRLVRSAGGELTLASAPGSGVTATVRLPRRRDAQPASEKNPG